MPALPSVLKSDVWEQPATPDDYLAAASHLMTVCEPEATDARQQTMTKLLASYDYTRAELLLAMREVPRDPEASHNYGRGFNVADVHRTVKAHREARSRLKQQITASMRDDLCAEHKELEPTDFHCTSYNSVNEKLYRYAPHVDFEPEGEAPVLPGDERPGSGRERTGDEGPAPLADVMSEAMPKDQAA